MFRKLYAFRYLVLISLLFCLGAGILFFKSQNKIETLANFFRDHAIIVDCIIYDFDLQKLSIIPGGLCDYDFETQRVLSGDDNHLILKDFNGRDVWRVPHNQVNHDVKIDQKRQLFYSLDFELHEVEGNQKGFSVLRGFDRNGKEILHWSSFELYSSLLNSKYRELLLNNYLEGLVRIGDQIADLMILINNIQLLEETPLKIPVEKEEGRYLILTFTNLNHLGVYDIKTRSIVWRYDFFPGNSGAFIHTPQFINEHEISVFTNINPIGTPSTLNFLSLKPDKFYSDICVFDIRKQSSPTRCWLTGSGAAAKIMGSAQFWKDKLLLSYCNSKDQECRLELRSLDNEMLWSSKQIEDEFDIPFISQALVYRAKLIRIDKLNGLIFRPSGHRQ